MCFKVYDNDFRIPDTKNKYKYKIYPKQYKNIIII